MANSVTTASTEPAVDLEELKRHCQITTDDDDDLLSELVSSIALYVEGYLGRSIITKTWTLRMDRFPSAIVVLKEPPVQSIVSVKYHNEGGEEITWGAENYEFDKYSEPARLTHLSDGQWPTTKAMLNAVAVEYIAGYGDTHTSVPADISRAIMIMINMFYDNRDTASFGGFVNLMPFNVKMMLDNYRLIYL